MYKIEKDINVKPNPFPKAKSIWAYDQGELIPGSPFLSISQCA
jgi:hypothetical protein